MSSLSETLCLKLSVRNSLFKTPTPLKGTIMAKIVECAKVDPSSGCQTVIRGTNEADLMQKAEEHAKQHGIRQMTPEMKAKVKANIREAA